ncbi:MAG TPA: alginate lyase family protein [Streptosporangiaceae bacterium]|nr:alginate lyase family protein [Streptosporangiaceae bacterium]
MTRTVAPLGDGDEADWKRADWGRADWAQVGTPQLWRFHLHYWDWAWALAADSDQRRARRLFGRMWQSWQASVQPGRGDAWLPYPAALRAWSWCGLHRHLVAGTKIEDSFIAALAAHAGFLRRHLESDVGGNHLIKDLKGLIGLGAFFADERTVQQALDRLTGELRVQVLPDGGHYERAPAYHCQVLADLTDVVRLLHATERKVPPELPIAIRRMRRWIGLILSPGGNVPLLNDGYPVPPELIAAIRPGPPPDQQLCVLPDSGLVRADVGGWSLLADIGLPCPDQLPAHAHADTLGCLLSWDGKPLLVDTGTSSYAPGAVRAYERSTAAHNSVEVDSSDSTEVWNAFRAGRRARVRDVRTTSDPGAVSIEAVHDGYRGLPGRPLHRRRWSLTPSALRVDDVLTGRGRHTAIVRWHLPPGSMLRVSDAGIEIRTPDGEFTAAVTTSGAAALSAEVAHVAEGFARRVDAPVLACAVTGTLPIRITTYLQKAGTPA